MAKAFPKSQFFGFDYHDKSIEAARESAKRAGVADRVTFEVAKAKEFPGRDYDFVAVFDCLHDMGDPIGAAAHVRQSLAKDGTWMIVEPFANDQLKDNLNPVGRVYYSFSTLLVYALLAIAGSRAVPGCAGRRGEDSRRREFGRIQPLPARNGNAVQHRLRSSAVVQGVIRKRGGLEKGIQPSRLQRCVLTAGISSNATVQRCRMSGKLDFSRKCPMNPTTDATVLKERPAAMAPQMRQASLPGPI